MAPAPAYIAASVVFCAVALFACGGKSVEVGGGGTPDGGSGGSGFSGSRVGGTGVAGTGLGGTGVGGRSSGGGGTGGSGVAGASGAAGALQCDALLDQSPWSLTVRLTNGTTAPIYFGSQASGCGADPLFQVADAMGAQLATVPYCQATCEQVMRGQILECPMNTCPIGSSITLQPGEGTTQQWSGLYAAMEKMPPGCAPAGGPAECSQVKHIEPGEFVLTAQAGTTLGCTPVGGAICSPCSPSPGGGCYTPGGHVQGPFISTKLEAALGPTYGVGDASSGMPAVVDLVFTN